MTNSLLLFDIFKKAFLATGKRLIIDLKTFEDAYIFFEVLGAVLVISYYNLADSLTEIGTE